MKVDVKQNIEKLETTLVIELSSEEFSPFIDEAFKKEVKNVTSDGFRKGKMPKNIFLQKYGVESLYNEAINFAIGKTYSDAIIDNNVKGVAFPSIDVKNVSEKDGLEYTAIVPVAPEYNEVDESKIKVQQISSDISDEEVNKEIEKLLESETELVVSDSKAKLGDTVVIDFKGFKDGEAFEGGEGFSYPLELGSNSFIPGFEEQLVGTKSGDDIEVKVTFPEGYQAENLAGSDAIFECKVHEVKVKEIPELSDEFVMNLGLENVNNISELKDFKKEELRIEKEKNKDNVLRENAIKAVDEYAKEIDINIHDKHIEEEINAILSNFENQNNIKLDEYSKMIGKSIDEIKEEVKESAVESIKRRVILDSLSVKHNIEVTEEDVDAEIQKLADMYKVDLEVIKQSVEAELSQIKSMIKDQKVLDKVIK